ncbi:MAG TPA: lipocalin-like domain-containing protein [Thermoanaerobaculia bacterium]|nr:lipocalin-like domain-containing protein [Thermoanaerobaculia bacterium]
MKHRTRSLLLLALLTVACGDRSREPSASLSVAGALRGGDDRGYARATEPRTFGFPADHGPHPEFRTEWWYYTGNLATAEGRRFGFQLTFFRSALAPEMPERGSAWATRQAWLAHFALSNIEGEEGERFHSFERWSRGAVGLAGIQTAPFRVWVEDWSAQADGGDDGPVFPMRLRAAEGEVALDLRLEQGKPPVLQGERGLSRKSSEPGNASYYYSLTRMPATGTIRVGGESFTVQGSAWMDREWSTSSLGEGQVGWDWFALQLSDGTDLMLYQLRDAEGRPDPSSSGSIAGPGGETRPLALRDFSLEPLATWESPDSGARYPARWRVRVPSEELDLTVTPLLADQELDVSFRYWEGAVAMEGTRQGRPVRGNGYVELTGYDEPSPRSGHNQDDQ